MLSGVPEVKRFFIYALIIKGVILAVFAFLFNRGSQPGDTANYIFVYNRDYPVYIEPAINLVENGEYYIQSGNDKLYAPKMPGMTPIFVPLYLLFGLKGGFTALVLIQFFVDSLCCVLLGLVALRLFNSRKAFLAAFYGYALSTIVSVGSHYAVSELFCTSFSVLALYFVVCRSREYHFLLAGLFAAWAIFFRPAAVLLLVFLPLLALRGGGLKALWQKTMIRGLLLFFIPFLVADSLWIIRNYRVMNRFVPADLIIDNFGSPVVKSVFGLIKAFGGDLQSWNPDSEMRWFGRPGTIDYDERFAASNPFPAFVFRSGVTLEELQLIRSKYYMYNDSASASEKERLDAEIKTLCQASINKFRANSPISYYVLAPLRVVKTLVFIKRPYGFGFKENSLLTKLVRMWHFVAYYLPLIFFFCSFAWIFRKADRNVLVLVLLVVSHVLLYGFILRYSENRYLVPVYPFITLVAVFSGLRFFDLIVPSAKNTDRGGQLYQHS